MKQRVKSLANKSQVDEVLDINGKNRGKKNVKSFF